MVRQDSFIAKWNADKIKTYVSAAYSELPGSADFARKYSEGKVNYLPFRYVEPDLKTISPYCLTAMSNIRLETDAELVRLAHFPLAPSRLSAIYAFGDDSTVQKASLVHGWDIKTVRRVRLETGP